MPGALTENYTVINFPDLQNRRIACLTLDLEQDYGDLLEKPSYEGLEHIPELVNFFKERGSSLTYFVQGSLLETHLDKVKQLSQIDTEFELHSYSHPGPKKMNTELEITRGREAYKNAFGNYPIAYRSPLGFIRTEDYHILASQGFKFDSSVFPSLRPGVFNNTKKPIRPFRVPSCEIIEFPFTVFSSVVRIPIALSYIKLFGSPYLQLLKISKLPKLVVVDLHLHDLFKLNSSNNIPLRQWSPLYRWIFRRVYQRGSDRDGLHTLDKLITILKRKGYVFQKLGDVYEAICK